MAATSWLLYVKGESPDDLLKSCRSWGTASPPNAFTGVGAMMENPICPWIVNIYACASSSCQHSECVLFC